MSALREVTSPGWSRERSWQQYRAEGVAEILKLMREDEHWWPSVAQMNWLSKYATEAERIQLAEEGVLV